MEEKLAQASTIRPRMSAAEISLMETAFDSARVYLEFGSGGTTLRAAQRSGLQCFSVEADIKWISRLMEVAEIQTAVDEKRLSLFHADIGPTGMWSVPADQKAELPWENYCLSIWKQLPSAPDLILIDGRFRLACCIVSLLACPAATRIFLHDFGLNRRNRASYVLATELADIVDSCETLVMLERKPDFDNLKAVALLDRARKEFW